VVLNDEKGNFDLEHPEDLLKTKERSFVSMEI
jgi:hypothetical protein